MQTESKKKITNVENCEKTPTLSSLSTIFIRLQNGKKKKKSPYCPPFGDVIIDETGTRLTQGVTGSDGTHSKDQGPDSVPQAKELERGRVDRHRQGTGLAEEGIRPNDSE